MVRFKNRWLLVEFLQPSQLAPGPVLNAKGKSPATWAAPVVDDGDVDTDDEDDDDESYTHASSSRLPFMLPIPTSVPTRSLLSGDAKTRQKNLSTAIRQSVLEVFGDDGHSKCSSLAVSYFSPATSLAILRVSRDHYRLAWAAVNLLTDLEGLPVVPRVIAVSGTLKKLCRRAKVYHRLATASILGSHTHRKDDHERVRVAATVELKELETLGETGS